MPTVVKVVDRGLLKILKGAHKLDGDGVKVGILEGSGTEPTSGADVLDVAIFNEFGTEHMPARPAVGDFFEKNRDVLGRAMARQGKAVMAGTSPAQAMATLGEFTQKHQKAHILASPAWAVPNAASTVRKKGSSTPLVDHGVMLNAVRHERLKR